MEFHKPAISVENISKWYRIGMKEDLPDSMGEALQTFFLKPLSNFRKYRRLYRFSDMGKGCLIPNDMIWALRDISFSVNRGETVGIIGKNGAGKSTLLKIISRITPPSKGMIVLRGRVSALLEVGTGFHQELTGRENVFLNGTILGMRKREVEKKFDEIVDFSGIEKFIDTPVKRYSSGMRVRLAFSVAAHLDPEILVVDEVLAVGDAEFQRKCLGKLEDISKKEGRTVFFVSHNMGAIQSLCDRAICIEEGHVLMDGSAGEVVQKYLASLAEGANHVFDHVMEKESQGAYFTGASIVSESGETSQSVISGQPIIIELYYRSHKEFRNVHIAMTIYNHLGLPVSNFNMNLTNFQIDALGSTGIFRCKISQLPLPLGQYRVAVALSANGESIEWIPNALIFEVDSSIFFKTGRSPNISYCTCMIPHKWEHSIAMN